MYTVEQRVLRERPVAVVRGKARLEEMSAFLGHAYGTVAGYLERLDLPIAGMPYARCRHLGDGDFEIEAGFPVPVAIEPEGEVEPSILPGGTAVATWHVGPYQRLGAAYEALMAWVADHDGELLGPAWEVYYTDPNEQPDPETWRTEVVQPYR
jgi:effector-binding domain-containing protein